MLNASFLVGLTGGFNWEIGCLYQYCSNVPQILYYYIKRSNDINCFNAPSA